MFTSNKNRPDKIEIHQFVPIARYGDAVFDNTLTLQSIFRKWGYISNIYYLGSFPPAEKEGIKFNKFPRKSSSKRIIIYHFAIGSLLTQFMQYISCPKILIYHNMTPVKYLYGVDDNSAMAVIEGQDELRRIKDDITLALGDSEYNRMELERDYGFRNSGVLPIAVDFDKFERAKPDSQIIKKHNDGKTNFLFVGKIAPNKCQDDIIKVFYYYQKYINSDSRLFLIGSTYGMEIYYEYIKRLIKKLDLEEKVVIPGHISIEELVAYYNLATLFLCLSEHEGFCVPLLESMHFNVPIIAYKASVIPETLGNAGVLINRKEHKEIAELSDLIVKDHDLRMRIVKTQKERLHDFRIKAVESELKKYIDQTLSELNYKNIESAIPGE